MTEKPDIQFEVWQDGDMVAGADSLSDAHHFMLVYGQDGPVEAKTAVTVRTPGFTVRTPAPEGDEAEITPKEMFDLFGDEMPIEAVNLLAAAGPDETVGQVRAKVRQLAARRTPAPEGEVVAWGCFDANGLDDKLVYRDRRRAEDMAFAFTPSMTVKPLYASPVVSVGVGEQRQRVAAMIAKPGLFSTDNQTAHRAASPYAVNVKRAEALAMADAILAALGSRSKASVPTEGGQAAVLDYSGPFDLEWLRGGLAKRDIEVSDGYSPAVAALVALDHYRGALEGNLLANPACLATPASPIPGGYEPSSANELDQGDPSGDTGRGG